MPVIQKISVVQADRNKLDDALKIAFSSLSLEEKKQMFNNLRMKQELESVKAQLENSLELQKAQLEKQKQKVEKEEDTGVESGKNVDTITISEKAIRMFEEGQRSGEPNEVN